MEFHRQAAKLILKCPQSNLSEAITKAKRLITSNNISTTGIFIYKQMETFCPEKHSTKVSFWLHFIYNIMSVSLVISPTHN